MTETRMFGKAAADRLRATTEELIADVRSLPPDLIHWIPAEGVWTVMDNLCHIREFVPFWTKQALHIVTSPGDEWGRTHTDQDRMAAVTDTKRYALDDVLRDIRAAVEASATTIAGLTDAALSTEALSRNPRWGVKPASFVVDDLIVGHVAKHLGQIRRNVSQFNTRT